MALAEFAANGLFLGAIYALLAVPMSIVWVTTDVIDIATGGYAVAAGVIAVMLGVPYGPVAGIGAALLLGAVSGGIFLGFHALRVMSDAMLIVLATFALMLAIESAVLTSVGTTTVYLDPIPGNVEIGSILLPYQGLFNFAVATVLMAGLALVLKFTPIGLRMRACAVSDRSARLAGIPVRRTQFWTFVVAAGLAGTAGVLAALSIGMAYSSTFTFTTAAFSGVVLLGRAGPLPAFCGALMLGVVQSIGEAYLPNGWAAGLPSLLIILVLASGIIPMSVFKGVRP